MSDGMAASPNGIAQCNPSDRKPLVFFCSRRYHRAMADRGRGSWRGDAEAMCNRLGLEGAARDELLDMARQTWEAGRLAGAGSRPHTAGARRSLSMDPELGRSRLLSGSSSEDQGMI